MPDPREEAPARVAIGSVVARDVNISQTFIQQRDVYRRRTWRHVEIFLYPAIVDDAERRQKYVTRLATFLHVVFEQREYAAFTGLLGLTTRKVDGEDAPFYELISHQIDYIGEMAHAWRVFFSPDQQAKEDLARATDEKLMAIRDWRFRLKVPFSSRLQPVSFVYDRRARAIEIQPPAVTSTNPVDFPHQVDTTSEALTLLGNLNNSQLSLIDWDRVCASYPLYKLFAQMMDHRAWRPDMILIDAEDFETWDFVNPAAEAEIQAAERRLNRDGRRPQIG